MIRLAECVVAIVVVPACASVKEYDAGNGVEGVLDMAPAAEECAAGNTRADVSCIDHQCWTLAIKPGTHQLIVRRRVRIADCGGLGDCLRTMEFRPVEDQDTVFTVTPAGAATIEPADSCNGDLTVALTPHATGDFEVAVRAGSDSDRWLLRAVEECEPGAFACESVQSLPRCCCHPEVMTTLCP